MRNERGADAKRLTMLETTHERRRGPRVQELVLTPGERAAQGNDAGRAPSREIVVTLWTDNPEIMTSLRFYCAEERLILEFVDTAAALLAAAARSVALIIDCSIAQDALDRCRAVVSQTTPPVLICHPDEGFVDDLRSITDGELIWLPPEWLGSRVRDKLRLLTIAADEAPHAMSDAAPSPSPTPREREVLALKAGGRSVREIANLLGVSQSTVKSHISNALKKQGGDG